MMHKPCRTVVDLVRPSTSLLRGKAVQTWMPATSAGMTNESVVQFEWNAL